MAHNGKLLRWTGILLAATAIAFGLLYASLRVYFMPRVMTSTPTEHLLNDDDSLAGTFPLAGNWSAEKLAEARAYAHAAGSAAVVVLHNGKLVAEWGETSRRINAQSMRKSLMNGLYGVAIDKGLIDPAATLADLGIDNAPEPLTEGERAASVRDLLSARSGIYLPAAYETRSNQLKRPARESHPPGTYWYYNNWDFNTLGVILEQAAELNVGDAFSQWFAAPLGMQDFRTEDIEYRLEDVSLHPAHLFWMSARDLARFGQLYLQNGIWNGERILSEDWIRESTKVHSPLREGGYGYLWWIDGEGNYYADGRGTQRIFVSPADKLVVVHLVNTGGRNILKYTWGGVGYRVEDDEFAELLRLIREAHPDRP